MSAHLSRDEVDRARARFTADQEDAEYVEYTEAMERISSRRRHWRRVRRRFLETRGYGDRRAPSSPAPLLPPDGTR